MSEEDKEYYNNFAADAKKEYKQQLIEYRATGAYKRSKHFAPLEDTNIWIRIDKPSPLEEEIRSYETYTFPKRPAELDEEYEERQLRSVLRRKLRDRKWMDSDGYMLKEGVDFEELLEEERQKRDRKLKEQQQQQQQQQKQHNDGEKRSASVPPQQQQPKKKLKTAVISYESLKPRAGSNIGQSSEDDDSNINPPRESSDEEDDKSSSKKPAVKNTAHSAAATKVIIHSSKSSSIYRKPAAKPTNADVGKWKEILGHNNRNHKPIAILWENGMRTWEYLNDFAGVNDEANAALAKYAQENDLLKYRRWKFLQEFVPTNHHHNDDKNNDDDEDESKLLSPPPVLNNDDDDDHEEHSKSSSPIPAENNAAEAPAILPPPVLPPVTDYPPSVLGSGNKF